MDQVTPQRRQVAIGDCYVVECAVRADGSSPAEEFLRALRENSLPDDPEQGFADEQVGVYAWFLRVIQNFADTGEPWHKGAVNYLTDGIWEFKRRNKRITFYDTDGEGGYTRKPRIDDSREADVDPNQNDFWWFPNFDENIRLGHSFLKEGQETPSDDLIAAEEVRKEDLKHDRVE